MRQETSTTLAAQPLAARASFFRPTDRGLMPTEACRSPWNGQTINGISIAGLLVHAADAAPAPADMLPAHITIDILGPVPFDALRTRAQVTRPGRSFTIVESELLHLDRPVARARMTKMRQAPSPSLEAGLVLPDPERAPATPFLPPEIPLGELIETRQVRGALNELGGGACWTRMNADLIEGERMSSTVHAAMIADFGNGLARAVAAGEWTFANVDISLHMVRRPVGEWLLVDADVMLQGLGVGLTTMTLSDRRGAFGQAHQSLLIAPV
jgi:hypothetical protein